MTHAAPESGETFTTGAKGSVSTAKVGRAAQAVSQLVDEPATYELVSGGPIIPTPVRVIIYAVGTPVAAAASFVAGTDVFGPVVSTVAGAIAAAAVAAVGTTALGNLNR